MLTKLPGSKWWVETDENSEIIGTYNKTQVIADINAIQETLNSYPNPTQNENDIADLLVAIVGKWTPEKNARIVSLIDTMFTTYMGSSRYLEAVQLRNKLASLIALRERLV